MHGKKRKREMCTGEEKLKKAMMNVKDGKEKTNLNIDGKVKKKRTHRAPGPGQGNIHLPRAGRYERTLR
jgi:hypothetical protein